MEKKIATAKIAGAIWLQMERPNCSKVLKKLVEDGYAVPTHRTITKWRDKYGWPKTPRAEINAENAEKTGGAVLVQAKRAQKAALQAVAEALTGREGATPEDLVPLLTGQNADGTPVNPEQQEAAEAAEYFKGVKQRLEGYKTTEELLEGVTAESLRAAIVLFGILGGPGRHMIREDPIAVGKAFEAIGAGLEGAASPLDRVIALRAAQEKTIGIPQPNGSVAELLPPEEDDPLAAAFKAEFVNGHGA